MSSTLTVTEWGKVLKILIGGNSCYCQINLKADILSLLYGEVYLIKAAFKIDLLINNLFVLMCMLIFYCRSSNKHTL